MLPVGILRLALCAGSRAVYSPGFPWAGEGWPGTDHIWFEREKAQRFFFGVPFCLKTETRTNSTNKSINKKSPQVVGRPAASGTPRCIPQGRYPPGHSRTDLPSRKSPAASTPRPEQWARCVDAEPGSETAEDSSVA